MAGWKIKNNSFSTTESVLWRKAGTSAYQLQETTLKNDKIWCTSVVAKCQGTDFLNDPVQVHTEWSAMLNFPLQETYNTHNTLLHN